MALKNNSNSQFEVWAQIQVSSKSVTEIHRFFRDEYYIDPKFLIQRMHLTIYHARRPMSSLNEIKRTLLFSIDTLETRFMVLAPGGENPRPDLIPGKLKVGIRVKNGSTLRKKIIELRDSLIAHETEYVLGNRKPSTKSRNAFGARNFQPHIALLNAGSGIQTNLTEVGNNFRDSIPEIYFDKFIIQKVRNY